MRFPVSLLFVSAFLLFPLARVRSDRYSVEGEVVRGLLFEGKDREEWLAEIQAKVEKTPEDHLRIFFLAARNGDEAAALDALERFGPVNIYYDPLHWTVYTLKNSLLARHLVERFPQAMSGNFSLRDFFPDSLKTAPEAVQLWVEARFHEFSPVAAPAPYGWRNGNPWFRLRIEAFRNAGRLEELLDELQAKAQAAPDEPTRTAACEQLTTGEIPTWLSRIGGGARADGNERVAAECKRRLKNLRKY